MDNSGGRRHRCPGHQGCVVRGGPWFKVLVPSHLCLCWWKELVHRDSGTGFLFKSEQERLAGKNQTKPSEQEAESFLIQ